MVVEIVVAERDKAACGCFNFTVAMKHGDLRLCSNRLGGIKVCALELPDPRADRRFQ